LVVFILVRI